MKERLFRILNLKVSESKYVFDLLGIQLFIGIANSFINIVSLTLFIHYFSAKSIAWGYVAVALVLTFLNLGYEKLEKQLSPLHLLRWVIVGSCVVLTTFWLGLLTLDKSVMIFSLLVLSTLFYMVTGYAYWGLVSLLFNIRESRRVFSIVGSGDIPAKLIGYSFAPLLVPLIGLENLLVFSVLALVVGLILLNQLIHKKRWERILHRAHVKHHHPLPTNKTDSLISFFFQHKLIFIISVLSLLSYNVFNLIDFTFVTQIKAKVHNISTLSTYIAVFFAVGRLVAFVLKIVFTSRVIERLGVVNCLLITPLVLATCSAFIIFFSTSNNILYIVGLMAMITEVLRSAMQEPVFFILFQPLNEHLRLRGHIIAKGYMLAPSLFIVGASLLLLQYFNVGLSINLTINILLVNLVIWGSIIYFIRGAYFKTLHQSIARGIFTGDVFKIKDPGTITLLLEKVASGTATEKIYALKVLAKSNYDGINPLLKQEMETDNSETKQFAISVLEENGAVTKEELENWIAVENNNRVKNELILLLCKIDTASLHAYSHYFLDYDYDFKKRFILLLLKDDEFDYLYKGIGQINHLLQSPDPAERELALDVISELKTIKFTEAIERLINDSDPAIKRNAIIAACKLRNKAVLPFLFERLDDPSEKYMVIQGFFHYGDVLFNDIDDLPADLLEKHKAELVKTAAKVKGPISVQFLLKCLYEKNSLEEKVIHVLWAKSFQAEVTTDIHAFKKLLAEYLDRGVQKISYHTSVPLFEQSELIKHSIGNEIWNDLTTALKIAAMLYSRNEINRVIELVENKDRHKLFNAMEMLEMVLPKKMARQVNDLFDYILEPTMVRRKEPDYETSHFLREIVTPGAAFNHWTKAICLYTSLKNDKWELIRNLSPEPELYENIVLTETRTYVMNSIQQTAHADY